MALAKPWKFTQIGGKKKTFTLDGASAPHGRARAKPLVKDAIKLRMTSTYYPGNNLPSRHIFGTMAPDWELNGRFEDKWLGKDGAKAFVSEIKSFLADQLPITIEWGDIVAATGMLTEFEPAREAEWAIAWRMVLAIDSDDTIKQTRPKTTPLSPADRAGQIALQLELLEILPKSRLPAEFNQGFLDSIDDFVSAVQGATGDLVRIAGTIGSFETALAGEVARLRGAIGQVRTAALTLSEATMSTEQDAILQRDWASSTIALYSGKSASDVAFSAALALLADLDSDAEIAQRGRDGTVYVVLAGDSWETISSTFYGDPGGADKLRQANGATYGDRPQAGKRIRIPT